MVRFTREARIADNILWVDGISGTAKSMLFPVLGSFERVEVTRMEHIFEYLCLLHHFKKIEDDAAIAMMRLYADLSIHDNMISREVNFRPHDDSSVFNIPKSLMYLRRLFHSGGLAVLDRIRAERPILHIMTHQVLGASRLAFDSYGERLRIIEMVRHPLYVMPHWIEGRWVERYGTDPKEMTLWLEHGGRPIPWWAEGREEEYLGASPMGRVIISLDSLTTRMMDAYDAMDAARKKQVLFIPFEGFATDPWTWIEKIESFLGTNRGPHTSRMLKKQRCPRVIQKGTLDALLKKNLQETPEPQFRERLLKLCADYERNYGRVG